MTPITRRAFTLVEILVVIAVILLLVGLIVAGSSHVLSQQKARNTQGMMQALTVAIDQFRETNPLRAIYDVRGQESFGSLPPYQLQLPNNQNQNGNQRFAYAPYVLEADPPIFGNPSPDRNPFAHRIARDMGCRVPGDVGAYWEGPEDDENTDIRALYAYLKIFLPGSLNSVPESNIRKIPHAQNRNADFHANPKGPTAPTGHDSHVDVLGFVDGWGVPLDYAVMAKFQWGVVQERDSAGSYSRRYRVTDRQIMLRSRGMDLEKYNAWVASNPGSPPNRATNLISPQSAIYNAELPKPWAALRTNAGDFATAPVLSTNQGSAHPSDAPGTQANGWLRVVGKLDEYNYRPD